MFCTDIKLTDNTEPLAYNLTVTNSLEIKLLDLATSRQCVEWDSIDKNLILRDDITGSDKGLNA